MQQGATDCISAVGQNSGSLFTQAVQEINSVIVRFIRVFNLLQALKIIQFSYFGKLTDSKLIFYVRNGIVAFTMLLIDIVKNAIIFIYG